MPTTSDSRALLRYLPLPSLESHLHPRLDHEPCQPPFVCHVYDRQYVYNAFQTRHY